MRVYSHLCDFLYMSWLHFKVKNVNIMYIRRLSLQTVPLYTHGLQFTGFFYLHYIFWNNTALLFFISIVGAFLILFTNQKPRLFSSGHFKTRCLIKLQWSVLYIYFNQYLIFKKYYFMFTSISNSNHLHQDNVSFFKPKISDNKIYMWYYISKSFDYAVTEGKRWKLCHISYNHE